MTPNIQAPYCDNKSEVVRLSRVYWRALINHAPAIKATGVLQGNHCLF